MEEGGSGETEEVERVSELNRERGDSKGGGRDDEKTRGGQVSV